MVPENSERDFMINKNTNLQKLQQKLQKARVLFDEYIRVLSDLANQTGTSGKILILQSCLSRSLVPIFQG